MNEHGHRSRGIFVTGTDTGVGKTWVTAGIAGVLHERHYSVGVWKPVQSGVRVGDPEADSYLLKQWSGVEENERQIATYTFQEPVSPVLAAKIEGEEIEVDKLLSAHKKLTDSYNHLLVEGAGGLAVPLRDDFLIIDLAKKLGYPLLIVGRPGLGTVNHTLQTIAYAKQAGLDLIGVVLNGYPMKWLSRSSTDATDLSLQSNPHWIEHFSGVKVIGQLPYMDSKPTREQWLDMIERYVHMDLIIEYLGGEN
jgi:dethiobiotin synthetase